MSTVGPLLSEYRKMNRLSQLELSLRADVSSRHISFIETGRTNPSRSMLLRLADVLNLQLKDSNLLLHSGGFAATYSELDLDSSEMEPVRRALNLILENHNPYPALVVDGNWNVLLANKSQLLLSAQILDKNQQLPTRNLLEALFRPDGYRPYIANWDAVASHLLRRLRKQVLAYAKPELDALYRRLLEMSPPENWQQPGAAPADGPMLTLDYVMAGQTLSLFTTLSQFGTALDIGMQELMIESYFPANQASRQFFDRLSL